MWAFALLTGRCRLCAALIIAIPAATPKELKNPASYALGGLSNRASRNALFPDLRLNVSSKRLDERMGVRAELPLPTLDDWYAKRYSNQTSV